MTLPIFDSNLKFKYKTDSTGSGGAGAGTAIAISGSGPVEHFYIKWGQDYVVGVIWSPDYNRIKSMSFLILRYIYVLMIHEEVWAHWTVIGRWDLTMGSLLVSTF